MSTTTKVTLVALSTVMLLVLGIALGLGQGYENAYRDMKSGRIEQQMKERHPHVWVELNELNKR
jgi:hypothetical protein